MSNELYDKLMDTVDIEQVDNSDIESDTEGSDSSDDDGLPTNINSSISNNTKKWNRRQKLINLRNSDENYFNDLIY